MAWYPKEQSNFITNLVSELNGCLGGIYFTAMMEAIGHVNKYSLNLTNYGLLQRKYGYLATEEMMTHDTMANYLRGILLGFRAAKMKK